MTHKMVAAAIINFPDGLHVGSRYNTSLNYLMPVYQNKVYDPPLQYVAQGVQGGICQSKFNGEKVFYTHDENIVHWIRELEKLLPAGKKIKSKVNENNTVFIPFDMYCVEANVAAKRGLFTVTIIIKFMVTSAAGELSLFLRMAAIQSSDPQQPPPPPPPPSPSDTPMTLSTMPPSSILDAPKKKRGPKS